MMTLVNAIHANTILAIRTVAFDMLQIQYIFDPKIYTKLDGTPISIIGNASNKMGEFSLVHLRIALIALFPCVIQKELINIPPLGKYIPLDLLVGTSWENSNETFACAPVPNIFFTYFGQSLTTCRITSDTTKMAFQFLGPGYAAWASLKPIISWTTMILIKSLIVVRALTITTLMFLRLSTSTKILWCLPWSPASWSVFDYHRGPVG